MDLELKEFESKINNITEQFMSLLDANGKAEVSDTPKVEDVGYKMATIPYETSTDTEYPRYAVRFDTAEEMDLNKKLESLYETKNEASATVFNQAPTIAFADSNIGTVNSYAFQNTYGQYDKNETNSTNNKEVYEMGIYSGEEKQENVLYNFATIPTEQALVEKRSFADVLFMDIPWDTKIDIWGGIKKFCGIQVKITF